MCENLKKMKNTPVQDNVENLRNNVLAASERNRKTLKYLFNIFEKKFDNYLDRRFYSENEEKDLQITEQKLKELLLSNSNYSKIYNNVSNKMRTIFNQISIFENNELDFLQNMTEFIINLVGDTDYELRLILKETMEKAKKENFSRVNYYVYIKKYKETLLKLFEKTPQVNKQSEIYYKNKFLDLFDNLKSI